MAFSPHGAHRFRWSQRRVRAERPARRRPLLGGGRGGGVQRRGGGDAAGVGRAGCGTERDGGLRRERLGWVSASWRVSAFRRAPAFGGSAAGRAAGRFARRAGRLGDAGAARRPTPPRAGVWRREVGYGHSRAAASAPRRPGCRPARPGPRHPLAVPPRARAPRLPPRPASPRARRLGSRAPAGAAPRRPRGGEWPRLDRRLRGPAGVPSGEGGDRGGEPVGLGARVDRRCDGWRHRQDERAVGR